MVTNPLILMVFWFGMHDVVLFPQTTPQVSALIKQLGHEKFKEREKASKKLELLGIKSLRALQGASTNKDLEIACRAKVIVDRYYCVLPSHKKEIPSIFSVPPTFTFGNTTIKLGKPAITKYVGLIIGKEARWKGEANRAAQYPATSMLVRDLLMRGADRKDVVKLLDNMIIINKYFDENWWPCGENGNLDDLINNDGH